MSKGLEALKELTNELLGHTALLTDDDVKAKETIIEKELKALEVIKNKKVNVFLLINCDSLEEYNSQTYVYPQRQLTQEEYNLLKEVLL